MSASVLKLFPEIDYLLRITSTPQSLALLNTEACTVASNAGPRWQLMHNQLQKLLHSTHINTLQKLQLASCERHFIGYYGDFRKSESNYLRALGAISHEHLDASLNLLATSSKCCAAAGNFERAIDILSLAFTWAPLHASTIKFWPIYSAAAVVCNRMTAHDYAVHFAEHASRLAEQRNIAVELQLTRLNTLNSYRYLNNSSCQQLYADQLAELEGGDIRYDNINQFLLLVHAALAALDRPQPDCLTAGRALAMAQDMALEANDYCLAHYLLAVSRYQLAYGQRQKAKDAILEAEYLVSESDIAFSDAIAKTLKDLGIYNRCSHKPIENPVSTSTWQLFVKQCFNAMRADNTETTRCPSCAPNLYRPSTSQHLAAY